MSNLKKKSKKSIHATISDESLAIIDAYKKEYGSKSAVVDNALKVLKKYKEPHQGSIKDMWSRAY